MRDDLKFAWRRLRHAPLFAAAAVLTVAIGVGANTAILSVADAVLFRPLPYEDADRIFAIQMRNPETGNQSTRVDLTDVRMIDDYHRGLGRVELLSGSGFGGGPRVTEHTPDGPIAVPTAAVTPGYFEVLGVRAARGRVFGEGDAAQPGRVAVLSHASWRQRFGGDDAIVGRTITIGTATFEVIGVLPPGFIFPGGVFAGRPEIVTVQERPSAATTGGTFRPIVKLEDGVTREQAQAEIDALAADAGRTAAGRSPSVPYLNDVRSLLYPVGRPVMQFMLAASGLVLLLGCANLANMLIARGRSRERETAIRAAMGAGRLRVVRPLLFEALMIGAAGAGLAAIVTWLAFDALAEEVPAFVYGSTPIGVDTRVVAITLLLGVTGALLFAAVPVWRALRLDVQAVIQHRHHGGRSAARAGIPMVAVQVALAVVLVFGAAVSARALISVLRLPLGFDPEHVLTVGIFAPGSVTDRQAFFVNILDGIRQRTDVVSAGAVGALPFSNTTYDESVRRPEDADRVAAGIAHVLPGFFETAGIPLRRGRLITWDDVRGHPQAAVLSESAARALFPGRDPLGLTFDNGRGRISQVVGVVADVRRSFTTEDRPAVYVIPGAAARFMNVVVRTAARRESTLVGIRRAVAVHSPEFPVTARWWLDAIGNQGAIRNPRFQTLILTGFAGIGLGLTAIGVFAAIAMLVAARWREIGVRAALGASPASMIRLMLGEALRPVVAGLLIGLVATRWLAGFAESQLYEVETSDPGMLAAAVATVLAATILGALLPARRAGRIDPVVALRAE
jgi:predicted permease